MNATLNKHVEHEKHKFVVPLDDIKLYLSDFNKRFFPMNRKKKSQRNGFMNAKKFSKIIRIDMMFITEVN